MRALAVATALLACACHRDANVDAPPKKDAVITADPKCAQISEDSSTRPPYMQNASIDGLSIRVGGGLAPMSAADVVSLRAWTKSGARGPAKNGHRISIFASPASVRVGEAVHVLHAHEVESDAGSLFVMGPKPIFDEFVDGERATPTLPEQDDPFVPGLYDGVVLAAPGLDANYEITTYKFEREGTHMIEWRLGDYRSNVLCIRVRSKYDSASPVTTEKN